MHKCNSPKCYDSQLYLMDLQGSTEVKTCSASDIGSLLALLATSPYNLDSCDSIETKVLFNSKCIDPTMKNDTILQVKWKVCKS